MYIFIYFFFVGGFLDLDESSPDPGELIATKKRLVCGNRAREIFPDLALVENLQLSDKNRLVCGVLT